MWSDEDVSEMDARLEGPRCPRCDDLLCGDTDVMVNGERWCSCCGYKAGMTGDDEATGAIPVETMAELVYGRAS